MAVMYIGLQLLTTQVAEKLHRYDKGCPQSRSERQRALREFTTFIRTLHEDTIPVDWADHQVQAWAFHKVRVVNNILGYMKAVVEDPDINAGRLDDKFKIAALRKRKEHVWFYACWELREYAVMPDFWFR